MTISQWQVRRGAPESDYVRQQREAWENQRLTVRCTDCPWQYTGRTITAVRKAREHRASTHPARPVQTPKPRRASDYCKVEGCRTLAATKQGRYARLCAQHREEAQRLAAVPARPQAPAPRPRGPRPGRHVARDRTHCKVPGCTGVPARFNGQFAYLCDVHYEERRVELYGPRRAPGQPRPPKVARVPGQCKIAGCTEPWVRPRSRGAHLCAAHLQAYITEHHPHMLEPKHLRYRGRTPRKFTPAMEACAVQLLDAPLTVVQIAHAAAGPWGFSTTKVMERTLYEMQTRLGLRRGRRPMPDVPLYNRAEVAALVAAAVRQ